ncbi:hypothetical protein ACFW16_07035 [Inquilinus sp. NPDC058860]|uniref:hypothetical protein n=1 Tax=Inquilinus sp. NPDC058860 TaxID=3346652 RepID=UPI0036ABBFB7
MKVIYRITYPNWKIYVGKDLTNSITYFGSPNPELLERDFPPEARKTFTITRQILWESDTASDSVVSAEEVRFIRELHANDPKVGYNRWPRFRDETDRRDTQNFRERAGPLRAATAGRIQGESADLIRAGRDNR